ncbi:VanW family protein [Cohnella caldifontis]|uniref:VanW family protein n=1 Tax=Cohnella caldifontis TaxID=3027471 RepID=UPI0023EC8EB7|nr:VanW family protein [Cohnella sp. YIM B05605]
MRKGWLFGAAVLLLVTAGGGTAAAAYAYGGEDRLPAGFAVGGLSLEGRTASEALALVRGRLAVMENAEVEAVRPGTAADGSGAGRGGGKLPVLTMKDLGLQVQADEGIQALEEFRDRGWWEKLRGRVFGMKGGSYAFTAAWDEAVLEREVREKWGSAVSVEPKDAARAITEDDRVVYTAEAMGAKVDVPALISKVRELKPGSLADPDAGKRRSLKLPVAKVVPRVTVASLKAEGIERKIAEFTTSFETSGAGRSHNVTAAAMALNETLLMPDEVFEYGKIVRKADREYGYQEAPVIVQGKLTPGIGGGICQVSSTLYNAILQAGLEVVERRNHSLIVHYLPPGLDATFADGFVNFRFRNSTGKQLLIRTVVHDKHVTVKLFGTMDESVSYRLETKTQQVVPPKVKYVGNESVAPGEDKVLQQGEPGYVVDTYRIKLVNGREVSRERLPRSTYRAQEELIAVNPADPRLKPLDTTPPPSGREGPVEPM